MSSPQFSSSYRIEIQWPNDLANRISVKVRHQISKVRRIAAFENAETRAACCALILRFQVSANQVPAAIEIRMVPDDPSDIGGLVPLEIPIVHSPATVEP